MSTPASRFATSDVVGDLLRATAETLDLDPTKLDQHTDLLKTGRLDSVAMMSLVAFIEDQYGVTLTIEDIVPENFSSVVRMEALLARTQR